VRGNGRPARRRAALGIAALICAAALPGTAQASKLRVVTLGGSGSRLTRTQSPASAPAGATASSIRVPDFSDEGLRTNGRIFGFDPREGAYSCSGTAISTPSQSIVLTAGHCVQEGGVTGRDLVFVPAYDHGKRPFGTFVAETAYEMAQWRTHENPDFDVAALRVAPDRFGYLTEAVGGRGWAVGRSRESSFQIYGYPAAALRGEELRSCHSHGLGVDALTYRFLGPPTMPGSCDMAGGSSGGAWIVDGEYVNGVTSYGYSGNPNRLYTSYFGTTIGRFLSELP
jgi:V8-like Glu-specific endopeptidase